jgi:hypothetical protein
MQYETNAPGILALKRSVVSACSAAVTFCIFFKRERCPASRGELLIFVTNCRQLKSGAAAPLADL